ncbi:putative reverse transcriptase domain-containing protein [Tanacetum coccineum]
MLTARKRVGPLPTHQLALRYSADYSSSNQFTSDDSSQDSPLETSLDSHSDSSSDSSSRHSSGYDILETPCDSPTATFERLSRKRCRSSFVPVFSPVRRALSYVCADLLPPPKRIRDSNSVTDLEVSSEDSYGSYIPREVGLGVDVKDSSEPYTKPDVDSDVQANIDECIAYANVIRARGMDVRDAVETTAAKEVESSARGTIEVEVDPRVKSVIDYDVCESVREDVPDHVTTDGAVKLTYETLGDLVQRFHDHAMEFQFTGFRTILTATYTRMTQDAINELISKRVDEAMKAYDAARNPEIEAEIENEQQDDHVEGDVNNRNGNPNVNNGGVVLVAKECTYQDLVKCQPLNFKGTKGVVGSTRGSRRWRQCSTSNLNKRTVGVDAAYAMTWKALMKLMIEVYYPRNEIQKMETGLWNLTVKGNNLTAYNQRLQELTLLCTKMAPKEEDKVEKYIGDLPDNIQGNLKGYAIKNAENKRRFNNNQRDNHAQQQPPFKRQNVNGQNVARAYTVENNVERKGYVGALPYCSKCRLHHEGPCMNRGNKTGNKTRNNKAKARAYAIGGGGANPDLNIIIGHPFDIDLMHVELGSFNVIFGMDWLAKYHAVIIYDEKIVRIPYGDEVLIIEGDGCNGGSKSKLSIISCTKTQKYIQKGCQVYLAQVTTRKFDDESKEKRLEDVPIVRDFPKVFPEYLRGLPPT